MLTENRIEILVMLLGICLVVLVAGILMVKFIVTVYMPFVEERDFIRMEIVRTRGNERVHWKHELRRLYIEQIPLIGVHLAEISRKRGRKKREKM